MTRSSDSGKLRPEDFPDNEIAEAVARYVDDLTAGRDVDPMHVLVENPGIGHEVLKRVEVELAKAP